MVTNIIITRATQATPTALHTPWQAYTAAGIGVVFAVLLFKPFFKNWSGFWDCVKYSLKPDWISWFQGEGMHDWCAELKLGAWLIISLMCGILSYHEFPKWLPAVFGN